MRAGGLSNFFTQDLEEGVPPAPEQTPSSPPSSPPTGIERTNGRVPATPHQIRSIRAWLRQHDTVEDDLLAKLQIRALDELSERRAAKLIIRLRELSQQPAAGAER